MERWALCKEPRSGLVFYANLSSGLSQWDQPSEDNTEIIENTETWWDIYDDRYKRSYFHNTATGQTVWVKPPGVVAIQVPRTEYIPPNNLSSSSSKGIEQENEKTEEENDPVEASVLETPASPKKQNVEQKPQPQTPSAQAHKRQHSDIPPLLSPRGFSNEGLDAQKAISTPAAAVKREAAGPMSTSSPNIEVPPRLLNEQGLKARAVANARRNPVRSSDRVNMPAPLPPRAAVIPAPLPPSLVQIKNDVGGTPTRRMSVCMADSSPLRAIATPIKPVVQDVHGGAAVYAPPPPQASDALLPFWQEFFDSKCGRYYYHNSKTEETTWNRALATGKLDLMDGTSLNLKTKEIITNSATTEAKEGLRADESDSDLEIDESDSNEEEEELGVQNKDENENENIDAKQNNNNSEPNSTELENLQPLNTSSEITEVSSAEQLSEVTNAERKDNSVEKEKKRRGKKEKSKSNENAVPTKRKSDEKEKEKKKKKKSSKKKTGEESTASVAKEANENTAEDLLPGWEMLYDPKWGTHYYYCTYTGESTWSKPVATGKLQLMDGTSISIQKKSSTVDGDQTEAGTIKGENVATAKEVNVASNGDSPSVEASTSAEVPESSPESPQRTNTELQHTHSEPAASKTVIKREYTTELERRRTDAKLVQEIKPGGGSQAAAAALLEKQGTATRGRTRSSTFANITNPDVHSLPQDLQTDIIQFQLEGYALKFFETHRKGVFRRLVPVREMLVHTKEPLPTSLIRLGKENLSKEAVRIFKVIQAYMGDKPSKENKFKCAEDIIAKALASPELRDEIYCQICKQTTLNPAAPSNILGWELFALCSVNFPPTRDLEQWLLRYVEDHIKESGPEVPYANYIIKKLKKICEMGPKGRIPTIAELKKAAEAPFTTTIFGSTLEEIMEMQNDKYPGLEVPKILLILTEFVKKLNGFKTEGIFRVPGDMEEVAALKAQLDLGNYDIKPREPHAPASLMKLFMRELQEPIIPQELYDECIKAAPFPDKCVQMLNKLPTINRNTVDFMIHFLREVAVPENREKTKMSVPNLAMVFAPNFLRCPSSDPTIIFQNTKFEQEFLANLIQAEEK